MDIPTTFPPPLRPGDTVAIIAPAGPVRDPAAINPALSILRDWGFVTHFDERIFESWRYLAGSDQARAEELMRCYEDSAIRAILALRGGYGCSRLVSLLDEHRLRHHCKLLIGFSDITTLHTYFRRRLGWVTIHGPMGTTLSRDNLSPDAERHLFSILTDPQYLPTVSFPQLESWVPGSAEGRLVGGCLSILVTSLGTKYDVKTEGKILFLEEYGEAPYRLDRMLTHLRLAGKLDQVAGILLGNFRDCESDDGSGSSQEVLRDLLGDLGVPLMANFPAGHAAEHWALPLGLRVLLDADRKELRFLEAAVANS